MDSTHGTAPMSGNGRAAVDLTDATGAPDRVTWSRDEPVVAPRVGRWVRFVPVTQEYLPFLYDLSTNAHSGFRFRFAGAVPSPESFAAALWQGILAQFVVVLRENDQPVGTVQAYNADLGSEHVSLAAAMIPEVHTTGAGIEATVMFMSYLFNTWNLRKIYLEMPEYNLKWIASSFERTGRPLLKQEGRMVDHSFFAGRWWDWFLLAVYRDDFVQHPAYRLLLRGGRALSRDA